LAFHGWPPVGFLRLLFNKRIQFSLMTNPAFGLRYKNDNGDAPDRDSNP